MGSDSSLDKSLPPEESFDVQVDLTASQTSVKARGRRDRKQTDLLAPESLEMYAREDARTAREMRALEMPATPPRPTDELPESPAPPERHVAVPERAMAPTVVDAPAHRPAAPKPLWPLVVLMVGLLAALVTVTMAALAILAPYRDLPKEPPTPAVEETSGGDAPPAGPLEPSPVEDGAAPVDDAPTEAEPVEEETGRPSRLKRPIRRSPETTPAPKAASPNERKPVPIESDGEGKKLKYEVVD